MLIPSGLTNQKTTMALNVSVYSLAILKRQLELASL